ncbi:general secretion pathway protein D [Caulobacter ginsengisoli]|uniref:General secretion pathway protein D n=1 Tax=Caulobacter ginsengisoli TaxID=400775 RepID=A0ABU0IUQ3_9CAUL|nr:type II secretion system secretin GspD [Caulobacter ginsengisoli]MDQ0465747.1 general secretion pathway protein D [Caulobacter ginsengisoli]
MNTVRLIGLLLAGLLLAACASDPRLPGGSGALPQAQPTSPAAQAQAQSSAARVADAPTPDRPGWTDTPPQAPAPAPTAGPVSPRVSMNVIMDRAPIAAAADAVLGDALQRPFRIDPAVTGEVSFRLVGDMSEADVLTTFDQALRASGAALSGGPGGALTIVPVASGPAFSVLPGADSPQRAYFAGGVAIYRARNVAAAELVRLLTPLAEGRAQVRADPVHEHVYISGDPGSVNSLLRTAELFDVDWMAGNSFQYYPLKYAAAKDVAEDLRRVYGGADGPVGTQVDLIDINRLNAIIIVAKSPALLAQTAKWIDRLDQPASPSDQRLRVIPLDNIKAEDFVKVIGGFFGGPGPQAPGSLAGPDSAPSAPQGANNVTADPRSNSVLIYANDAEYQNLLQVVRRLDVPPSQILIEGTVAEVRLNDKLNLGVQAFLSNNARFAGGMSTTTNGNGALTFPGLSLQYLGRDFKVVINALSAVTDVEVVSTPRLLVLANETATLQVGDQVPVITQTSTGDQSTSLTVNSVTYRDTGVVLTVTPRVGEGGRIFIDIQQEVSDVSATTTSDIDSPTIAQRKFRTQIAVDDGEVIALGGLIRTSRSKGDTGVPGLSRIPVLGAAFRGRENVKSRTELVVFLKATLVRNRADADRITDEISAGLTALGFGRDRR